MTVTFIAIDVGTLPVRRNWEDDALCPQTDPELFFPDKGGSTREAKSICRACPVRVDCLNEALNSRDDVGIRGGFSGIERRKMRQRGTRPRFEDAPQPRKGPRPERAA